MKVLIFRSRRLSYDSSWYFMEMFARGMRSLGVEVTVFELGQDLEKQEQELKTLTRQQFDGIFDVNSVLPSVLLDEKYYPDYFDAPFYELIVDHPLHVHPSLNKPLKNHRVICLDRYHKEYIETYYPHIQKVYVMPFGGIPAEEFGEVSPTTGQEKIQLLFPGTYTPLSYYEQQLDSMGDSCLELAKEVLMEYRGGCKLPIDQLFRQMGNTDDTLFTMQMYKERHVDRYVREWYRENLIQMLLKRGIVLDVSGFRWEMYEGEGKEYLRVHPPCSYPQQLALLRSSKVVLNCQPFFWDGPHDRILNAMCNQSVALTDSCEFLEREFVPDKELLVYDRNQPEEFADMVEEWLQKPQVLEEIAWNGYKSASKNHTWYRRVEVLLREIHQ